ncbi:PEP-CTERM sorting domain-containing protein [Rariglobus hedericola]|uniref:PEP-CTERM sorting domain-containing protein n=2 Tax=Rariglobus hedericola TaxID=2597822 RepID=A0A556QLL6_9BACT|nr:PEP-CTERM sorting domain-containing protein [Rariglobus hedericola]
MPSSFGGTSVGFITNITGGVGYLAVFRLNTTGGVSTADFRIFKGAKTDGTSVGAQVGSTVTLNSASLNSAIFNSTTFYTISLNVNAVAGTSIGFTGSILDSSNSSIIGAFGTISDSTPTFGGTSVALRLGTGGNNVMTSVDNLVLTTSAVPEPSTYALLGGLGALGFVLSRRRR